MSKSISITVALSLLVGAGAVAVWNSGNDANHTPITKTETKPRSSRSSQPRPTGDASQGGEIKWHGVTDATRGTETRLNLARQISKDMRADDIDYLFKSLRHQPEAHNNENWWVVMNEIMEQMRRKGVASDRFANELISIVNDSTLSEVTRDYAVQHLMLWVAPSCGNVPAESSPEVIAETLEVVSLSVTDPAIAHTSIPGTALMGLTVASSDLPPEVVAPIWEHLDPMMTRMLKGEINVPLSTRTTVIQSVAMRGSTKHLPLIQTMARNEKIDPSMRLSSIAALGVYRSELDRDYLVSLSQGNTRYRYAAKSALKKLTN